MDKTIFVNRVRTVVGVSVVTTSLLYSSLSHSVQPRLYQLGDGGAVAPHLIVELGSDSNPLRRNDGSDSSSYIRLKPSLKYVVQQRNNSLELGYAGNYLSFREDYCLVPRDADCPNGSPQFDKASYENHDFTAEGYLEISRQLSADLEISRAKLHQPAGTSLSVDEGALRSLTEPDSYDDTRLRAQLSYGAPLARGELRFGVTHSNREYSETVRNFDDLSEKLISPSAAILYRLGNKTQLLAGISQADVTGGNSARKVSSQYVGFELDASAITSGSVRLKNVRENFAGGQTDLEYIGWDLKLTWKPRRFSTVKLTGGRETSRGLFNLEDDTLATFRTPDLGLSTNMQVDWLHSWKERLSTQLGFQYKENKVLVDEQSAGALGKGASDVTTTVRAQVNYSLRRWLDVGAFVVKDTRNGGSKERDYSRSLVGISANGTI